MIQQCCRRLRRFVLSWASFAVSACGGPSNRRRSSLLDDGCCFSGLPPAPSFAGLPLLLRRTTAFSSVGPPPPPPDYRLLRQTTASSVAPHPDSSSVRANRLCIFYNRRVVDSFDGGGGLLIRRPVRKCVGSNLASLFASVSRRTQTSRSVGPAADRCRGPAGDGGPRSGTSRRRRSSVK